MKPMDPNMNHSNSGLGNLSNTVAFMLPTDVRKTMEDQRSHFPVLRTLKFFMILILLLLTFIIVEDTY